MLFTAEGLRENHRNSLWQGCVAASLPTTKPKKGLHEAPGPPAPPGAESRGSQEGLTVVSRHFLLSCKEGAAAELHPGLIKQEMRAAGPGAQLMMHSCSAGASLASRPFAPATGRGALPKQTFTWDILLLPGLCLGKGT